jgi:DnaJ-class molecular chaperone
MSLNERIPCPACGGAGRGAIGPARSARGDEEYVCPKCAGEGVIALPGVVKATPPSIEEQKRKATG